MTAEQGSPTTEPYLILTREELDGALAEARQQALTDAIAAVERLHRGDYYRRGLRAAVIDTLTRLRG